MIKDYLEHTNQLKMDMMDHVVKTNISILLMNHVIREGERADFIFN